MPPYIPSGDPYCFESVTWKHDHGKISTDEYLDCLLDHLLGAQHPEDVKKRKIWEPLSAIIQSCLFDPKFILLDDTSHLKSLLLNCWNNALDNVKQQGPAALTSLKKNGISDKILIAMIYIACDKSYIGLLDCCLSLADDPVTLLSNMENPMLLTGEKPDPRVWSKLLDNGWLSTSEESPWKISNLALPAMAPGVPHIELLKVLFNHGWVVSKRFFSEVSSRIDPDTMRYLASKCDMSKLNASNALSIAAAINNQIVEILIDNGMDINYISDNSMKDPRDGYYDLSMTPLHSAAQKGSKEIVKLLLQRGAKKDTKDSWGRTPVDLALQKNRTDIAELIQSYVS